MQPLRQRQITAMPSTVDPTPWQPQGLPPSMGTPGSTLGSHPPVIGSRAGSMEPEPDQEPPQGFEGHSCNQTPIPQPRTLPNPEMILHLKMKTWTYSLEVVNPIKGQGQGILIRPLTSRDLEPAALTPTSQWSLKLFRLPSPNWPNQLKR